MPQIPWPNGKTFAFTVFDDPDSLTVPVGREVYACLADLGFRTTKGVWTVWGTEPRSDPGGSCDDADYREWCLELQQKGFEMGFHNATQYTSARERTARGLNRFREIFGHDPVTMSNHYNCAEDVYWGDERVSGWRRALYNVVTRGANRHRFFGHIPGHPYFWGDLCKERVTYVRNFVFARVNTLHACPQMPYHDPTKPFVNNWYASSEGANVRSFTAMITEASQDQLAAEGGACIMYTHFAHGYVSDGRLDRRFVALMERLASLNGWFVPVRELLDHIRVHRGTHMLTDDERAALERRWLWDKIRHGSS